MDNNQIKHLEMILRIVERMARNSFLYKGWALSVFAALLLLSANNCKLIELLGLAPLLGFWGLDAYYLRQERLFRRLYDSVRLEKNETNFSMNTSGFNSLEGWFKVAISKSVLWFYFPMIIIIAGKAIFI